MLRAILILVSWLLVSLLAGSIFQPMKRLDNVAPIFIGYSVALVGAYWAGRYARCDGLFLLYAGVCSILWLPYYFEYVRTVDFLRRSSRDGQGYWITYCLSATCFMFATKYVARAGGAACPAVPEGAAPDAANEERIRPTCDGSAIAEPSVGHGAADDVI